jgi:hypothetical protein
LQAAVVLCHWILGAVSRFSQTALIVSGIAAAAAAAAAATGGAAQFDRIKLIQPMP